MLNSCAAVPLIYVFDKPFKNASEGHNDTAYAHRSNYE